MALSAGTRLGPYEIQSLLGAGGMGEVYRARDAGLGRDVALKILPDAFATDPERVARFAREARVLAALNHPHIGSIYGLEEHSGIRALVLELVEGPTLADRIAHGPVPIEDALPIARQIADALEAAHEQGIVHRDLKPANVKLRADGAVKVLDFGLAKAMTDNVSAADPSMSPTFTAASRPGVILGTAAYMSPEQARGKSVDKRTDVWAFGCVLFEMLTGRVAFAGETISDTIAAILGREPDWSRLPHTTPPALHRLLRRCLEKDPRRRLRDIGDARLEIDEIQTGSPSDTPVATSASRRRERLLWISALALVTATAAVAIVWAFRPPPAAEMRVEINTPPTTDPTSLAISPDGQKIVFLGTSAAGSRLWLRSLNSVSARPLAGTDAGRLPFWSPDSRSVGFFADGKLKRIDIDGGSATVLATAALGMGGAWNRAGAVLFAPTPASPILQIPAAGGELTTVTRVEAPRQVGHSSPQFLPDGRHFLYYVQGGPDASGVYIGQLGGLETKRLLDADAGAVYAASGQLLFVRQGTLLAQDFDPVQMTLTGNASLVAEQVTVQTPSAALSTSGAGPIVYRTGSAPGQQQLAWFDRTGKELGKVGDPDSSNIRAGLSLSPDGRHVALARSVDGNVDIWLLETRRGTLNRFTLEAADDIYPIWSRDGTRIVFSSTRKDGGLTLYRKSATGSGSKEPILEAGQPTMATDYSPDGRFLLYFTVDPKTGLDIWSLPLDRDRKPLPLVQTTHDERLAQFSPDGKWIAYESNESGRSQIYVQPFSGLDGTTGGKVPISTTGGAQVRWRHDGKELFYIALDDRLMAVPIRFASNGQAIEPGVPVPLFTTRVGGALQVFPTHQYVVSADGERFLMSVAPEAAASPITIVLNWAGRK